MGPEISKTTSDLGEEEGENDGNKDHSRECSNTTNRESMGWDSVLLTHE